MFVCQTCASRFPEAGFCAHDGSPLQSEESDPLVGSTIGPYRIEALIGVGGMGRVYKAVHPTIGSRVAVKVLAHGASLSPDLIARFFDEAKAVNLIRHENIVNILDLDFLPDGRPYIVMEYLDGAPLSTVIASGGRLPIGTVLRIMEDVLSALEAAHAQQIVHRDLKPDNIFISPKGRPKILDFGIAKLASDQSSMRGQTQEGSILGTPHYMSPEQAESKAVDARTDIYSMGVILFECLTGEPPFQASGLFSLLHKQVREAPTSPKLLRPEISQSLDSIILCALEKQPEKRWQSVSAMAAALQREQHGLPDDQWAAIGTSGEANSTNNSPSHRPSAPLREGLGHADTYYATPPPSVSMPPRSSRAALWAVLLVGALAAVAVVLLSQTSDAPEANALQADITENEVVAAAPMHDASPEPIRVVPDATTVVPAAYVPPDAAVAPAKDVPVVAEDVPVVVEDEPVARRKKPRPSPAPIEEVSATAIPPRDSTRTASGSSFDTDAYLPKARARARKAFDDAVLVRIDSSGVLPNGKSNLTLGDQFSVLYRFISPKRGKRPSTLPLGVDHKPTCVFYVAVDAKETHNYPLEGWDCSNYVPTGTPRCTHKQVWARAIADGAPKKNAVAELGFRRSGRSNTWYFSIKGTFSKSYPDDC